MFNNDVHYCWEDVPRENKQKKCALTGTAPQHEAIYNYGAPLSHASLLYATIAQRIPSGYNLEFKEIKQKNKQLLVFFAATTNLLNSLFSC